MDIETVKKNGVIIVHISGRLDGISSPELHTHLTNLTEEGLQCLVLNMEQLNFISSVGFRVIVASAKAIQAKKGEFLLSGLNGAVEKAFKMAALDRIFKIFDTPEAAISGKV